MAQITFERYEKKYLLDRDQYGALRALLGGRMREDAYGRYTICNLYYDTPDYRLIRASLEGPVYKEKLRLRSYGVPDGGSPVFLELKKKFMGVVYKRRAPLTLDGARAYLSSGERPGGKNQILDEIDWFLRFYRPEPRVFIGYDRVALSGVEDPELRMTFDTGLRWRDTALDLAGGDWGAPLSTGGRVLMELKIPEAVPLWLSHLLDRVEARPVSFSKYGACYRRHLALKTTWHGGKSCA